MSDSTQYNYPENFRKIVNDMADLYEAKNHDYGNSFANSYEKFGIISALVRISDKYNRMCTLAANAAKVQRESIRDTVEDLACYSVMLLMEMDKRNNSASEGEIK